MKCKCCSSEIGVDWAAAHDGCCLPCESVGDTEMLDYMISARARVVGARSTLHGDYWVCVTLSGNTTKGYHSDPRHAIIEAMRRELI